MLRVLWVHAPDRVRRVIQDKLRYFARADDGESSGEAEFSRFQETFNVQLNGKPEDPFRAIARSLTSISGWALAALCLRPLVRDRREVAQVRMASVVRALREKQPLSTAPVPLPEAEVTEAFVCIRAFGLLFA